METQKWGRVLKKVSPYHRSKARNKKRAQLVERVEAEFIEGPAIGSKTYFFSRDGKEFAIIKQAFGKKRARRYELDVAHQLESIEDVFDEDVLSGIRGTENLNFGQKIGCITGISLWLTSLALLTMGGVNSPFLVISPEMANDILYPTVGGAYGSLVAIGLLDLIKKKSSLPKFYWGKTF